MQVHGSNLANPVETRKHFGKVGPRVDVTGLRLEGRDVRQVERLPEPTHRRALDLVGPHGVERRRRHGHRQVPPSAVDEDRAVASVAAATRRPTVAAETAGMSTASTTISRVLPCS